MKAKIVEVFQSIQGEGKYLGQRQVFVRFWGCNLNCVWCDTATATRGKNNFKEYAPAQLLKKVLSLAGSCHSVSLTGGEPLLQTEFLKEFLPLLKKHRLTTYLETNGICHADLGKVIRHVDIISMDIKLPSSTKERSFWQEHVEFLKIAKRKDVFVKAVISRNTTKLDIVRMVKLIRAIDPKNFLVLQPASGSGYSTAVQKSLAYQEYCLKYLSNVCVIPQMHKIMNIK